MRPNRGAVAGRGVLQHLQVTIRVAERHDRPAADEAVDAHRLARSVVDEFDLGLLHENDLPFFNFELHHAAAATTCSGGMPYAFSTHGR